MTRPVVNMDHSYSPESLERMSSPEWGLDDDDSPPPAPKFVETRVKSESALPSHPVSNPSLRQGLPQNHRDDLQAFILASCLYEKIVSNALAIAFMFTVLINQTGERRC